MRNILLIILIAVAGYWYSNYHRGLDHASDLAGIWSQDFVRESVPCTMTMRLQADGTGSLWLNYVKQGQGVSRNLPGQWQCAHDYFTFTFSSDTAPEFVEASRFAGGLVSLDDRQLQFKSSTALESWSRVR